MRLQCHADILPLFSVKLKDMQHTRNAHLKKHRLAAAAKLHDITQFRGVQVLLGHGAEEMHPALIDAQDEFGGKEPNGVFDTADLEKDAVACEG